jgi:hypothetical protein
LDNVPLVANIKAGTAQCCSKGFPEGEKLAAFTEGAYAAGNSCKGFAKEETRIK